MDRFFPDGKRIQLWKDEEKIGITFFDPEDKSLAVILFDTEEAAGNFTVSVFRISESSGIPVMTLLQEFQGQSAPELTLTLAYYLNSTRSNSTLLGLNAATQPNFYAARNVRQ